MKQTNRVANTYLTSPKLNKVLNDGYRVIKNYGDYTLFEKVVGGKVLYRECFSNFDLVGEKWARGSTFRMEDEDVYNKPRQNRVNKFR